MGLLKIIKDERNRYKAEDEQMRSAQAARLAQYRADLAVGLTRSAEANKAIVAADVESRIAAGPSATDPTVSDAVRAARARRDEILRASATHTADLLSQMAADGMTRIINPVSGKKGRK